MATAKVTTKPAPSVVEKVTLEMNEAQAETVLAVLEQATGTYSTRKVHASTVAAALRLAGVRAFPNGRDVDGVVMFTAAIEAPKVGDRVKVVNAREGAYGANGSTGVLLPDNVPQSGGRGDGPKVSIDGRVWGLGVGAEIVRA